MNDKYITVTQLTRYIKYKIDQDENLNQIFLKGEISNFKAHSRGHYYFTLKDENARINAVMFQGNASKLKFLPQEGMKVLVTGKVSVYEANGGYQIYVNDMIEDGIGNLYVAFEQLKAKLEKEGLFASDHKKKIPRIPKTIGIVTAPTGAAIRDILSTIKRRWPIAHTILFPSLVQGSEAATSIVTQIKKAEQYPLDVLIVGRGGGSIEDLWSFNEEIVARAIFDCPIPIISAVGHEVDFTIADFVADLRAPTPTGAAEMAVPNQQDVINYLKQLQIRLHQIISKKLTIDRQKLDQLLKSYILTNPMSMYQVKEQKFDHLLDLLQHHIMLLIDHSKTKLLMIKNQPLFQQPNQFLLEQKKNQYLQSIGKLEALNPLLTLKRGYTITKKGEKIVTSVKKLKSKDKIEITLQDGNIQAEII